MEGAMKAKNVMPTAYLLMSILGMIALHMLIPLRMVVPSPWNLLGLLPLALGVALNLVADRALHTAKTTVKPLDQPTVLIRDGVFRLSRNPMYLGFVLVLLGIAVLLRSLAPFLIIPVFGMLMDRLFITAEEANLKRSFGEAWLQYSARVRRWL
jgi:protein-S-isoprenylcysteine O-methyltransferase Ste14